MSRFSIIVPVYNVENYLEECVKSVLGQSFPHFELILVDDGSKDSSGALCDKLSATDPRILVIHQENQGLSGARNTGIRVATGEYILFLDSDDWWENADCLQRIADRLDENHADVLSFNYKKSFDGQLSTPYFQNIPDAASFDGSLLCQTDRGLWIACAWNKVVRRELFLHNDLLFRQGITSEDIDWVTRLALCAETFDYLDLCIVCYRQRAMSITHSLSAKAVVCHKNNILESIRLLQDAPQEKAVMLHSFVAYQFSTLLFNYATLQKAERSEELTEAVRSLLPWLASSQNPKVRLLYNSNRFLGFHPTVALLQLKHRLGR